MGGSVSSGKTNDEMVDNLVDAQFINVPLVQTVFRAVDRGIYYTPCHRHSAYKDMAWKAGNLHISAPCVYSVVMESLKIKKGMSFLNLGSGTGYLSTIAGLLLGSRGVNHGIEIHKDVVDYAYEKLHEFLQQCDAIDEFDFCEPVFYVGNCLEPGCVVPEYDRIYCGAACTEENQSLIKGMLKIGGILILPYNERLYKITRVSDSEWTTCKILCASYSQLIAPSKSKTSDSLTSLVIGSVAPNSLKEQCRITIRSLFRGIIETDHPEFKLDRKQNLRRPSGGAFASFYDDDYDDTSGVEGVMTRSQGRLRSYLSAFLRRNSEWPRSNREFIPIVPNATQELRRRSDNTQWGTKTRQRPEFHETRSKSEGGRRSDNKADVTKRPDKKQKNEEKSPRADSNAEPKGSKSAEPKGSKSAEPKSSKSAEPKGSKSAEPKGSKSTEPKSSKSTEPRGSKSAEPRGSKSAEPRVSKSQDKKEGTESESQENSLRRSTRLASQNPGSSGRRGAVARQLRDRGIAIISAQHLSRDLVVQSEFISGTAHTLMSTAVRMISDLSRGVFWMTDASSSSREPTVVLQIPEPGSASVPFELPLRHREVVLSNSSLRARRGKSKTEATGQEPEITARETEVGNQSSDVAVQTSSCSSDSESESSSLDDDDDEEEDDGDESAEREPDCPGCSLFVMSSLADPTESNGARFRPPEYIEPPSRSPRSRSKKRKRSLNGGRSPSKRVKKANPADKTYTNLMVQKIGALPLPARLLRYLNFGRKNL